MPSPERCPQCPQTGLIIYQPLNWQAERYGQILYKCPRCETLYLKREGKSLTPAFGSLDLALYGAVDMVDPQSAAEQFAERWADLLKARLNTDPTDLIVSIRRELAEPKYRLIDFYEYRFHPSEDQLRRYLQIIADLLERKLAQ